MSTSKFALDRDASPERSRYRLLLEITDLVARAKSLPDAFKEFAAPVLALTGGELLNLALHDPRRNCMVNQYWKENRESGEFAASPDRAATGWAWKHQEPLVIPDTEHERRFPSCIPVLLNHRVRSYTVLPMSTPSHHFGALALGKNAPGPPDIEDIEFLSCVASMGALALEKEKAQLAYEEQQCLVAISRELSSSLALEQLLPVVLTSVRSIPRYERAVLCLLDDEGNNVHGYRDALDRKHFANHENISPFEQSFSTPAVQTRDVAFLTADDLRDLNDPLAKMMYEDGVRSGCYVPLIAADRIWGTLNLSSTTEHAFGPSEVQYLQQVANQIALALENARAQREIAQLKERLVKERLVQGEHSREHQIQSANRFDIVGQSSGLKRVLDCAAIVADTDSTVLITGETGTGKECIARLIHSMSQRKDRSLIKLNCAAIPTGLLESELFGHEKGAFTGAVSQKLGRLELADKGTLLLDEIGEIPLELQPKLLRVLQDQEFERLGGIKTIRVDVRLIAATNCDLFSAVEQKKFRDDLFYRLQVFPLHLPALRERREDIPMLIRHFVEKYAARLHKRIDVVPDEAVEAMMHWRWPGNIRELENFIERSVILSEGNRLNPPLSELREEI